MLELYGIALGALGGLFGTLAMSTIEAVAWKRWGLPGVFEWHENQMLVVRFLKLDSTRLHYGGIFGLHVANGLLGGVGFYLAVVLIDLLLFVDSDSCANTQTDNWSTSLEPPARTRACTSQPCGPPCIRCCSNPCLFVSLKQVQEKLLDRDC
jgi:hypothetical protein